MEYSEGLESLDCRVGGTEHTDPANIADTEKLQIQQNKPANKGFEQSGYTRGLHTEPTHRAYEASFRGWGVECGVWGVVCGV